MHLQLAAARISFAAFLLAAAVALTAVIGVRLGFFAYALGFRLMFPAVGLGLIAFAAGATWCITAFRRNQGEGRRQGLFGFFGALLLLYPPLSTQARGLTAPPIHDATSDPEDPPQFIALLKQRGPGMNSPVFVPQARIHYRGEDMTIAYALHEYYNADVTKPHAGLQTSPAKAFWRCYAIAQGLGWRIVAAEEKTGRIEATDTSMWFGRVADIAIRVRPAGPIHGSRVDARSASREGDIDYGANLARLKAFFSRLRL